MEGSRNNNVLDLVGSELDDCPPEDAVPVNGNVYCWVWNDPPGQNDFVPAINRWKNIYKYTPERKCQAYGLSVYRNIDALLKTKTPKDPLRANRYAMPAIGELDYNYGVIKNTPSRQSSLHFTWWPPCGLDVSLLFKVIRH